jgi:hypothetical protein
LVLAALDENASARRIVLSQNCGKTVGFVGRRSEKPIGAAVQVMAFGLGKAIRNGHIKA